MATLPSLRLVALAEDPPATEAERIQVAKASLEADQQTLKEIDAELLRADALHESASIRYESLSKECEALKKQRPMPDSLAETQAKLDDAKKQLDTTFERRQNLQQQKATLEERLDVQGRLLERLTNPVVAEKTPPAAISSKEADAAPSAPVSQAPNNVISTPPTVSEEVEDANPATDELFEWDGFYIGNSDLVSLRREIETKRSKLMGLRDELELWDQRLSTLSSELQANRDLMQAERQRLPSLTESLQLARGAVSDPKSSAETKGDPAAVSKLEQQVRDTQMAITKANERVEQLLLQIGATESSRAAVAARAETLASELRSLGSLLWFYESPIAPRNLYRWIVLRGPVVLAIATLAIIAIAGSRLIGRKIVSELVLRSHRGNEKERQERAETLKRVFQNAAQTLIVLLASLAILQQLGIDVTVLIGGAAVIGMAVAFGAQNLIKDYFSGFMILVENQYSVGNIIRIGDTVGAVENISMRMTVLRDIEGVVHFIPHGNVTQVSNLTHGWSRVSLDIGVAYKEDTDRVMAVLLDLLNEIRDDEQFGPMVLGEPEVLGVEALADSAVIIKVLIKTRPLKQWDVKREMLRRTKIRFEKLGIEIPFPHRSVLLQTTTDKAGDLVHRE
jgi:small conductance mechanosensitive channel